ncbi:hypothetical protein GCM10009618_14920 [Nesterenkonia lacusekhoensis]
MSRRLGHTREERTSTADHHDSAHKKDHQSSWDGGQLEPELDTTVSPGCHNYTTGFRFLS